MAFSSVLQMYLDWANSLLCEHGMVVNELKEFQDGRIFSLLIQILTDTQLFPASEDRLGDDEISSLDRIQTILDYLAGMGVKLKVTPTGVMNGELKSILDVIWAIILHLTVHSPEASVQQKTVRNGKRLLIQWCASQLGENSLDPVKGLAQCFEKNNKLAELIGLFCNYCNNNTETYVSNLTSALIAAEDNFGIAKSLLSPADVVRGTVEEHALTIYIALLRRKVTLLGTQNDQSGESSDLNTSVGLPEGLTDEVANSLSKTFSFKFMRSSNVSPSTSSPQPGHSTDPNPSSSNVAVKAQDIPAGRKVQKASRIPVSSSRKQQQTSSSVNGSGEGPESGERKRHQLPSYEQKQAAPSQGSGFKMQSGIPVSKTQKLSSIRPVQTSTPVSKQRRRPAEETGLAMQRERDFQDGSGVRMTDEASETLAFEECDGAEAGTGDDNEISDFGKVELDVSDIDETGNIVAVARGKEEELHLETAKPSEPHRENLHGVVEERQSRNGFVPTAASSPEIANQVGATQTDDAVEDQSHNVVIGEGSERRDESEERRRETSDGQEGTAGDHKGRIVKEDGDRQCMTEGQMAGNQGDRTKEGRMNDTSISMDKSGGERFSKGDGSFSADEVGLFRRGDELSFMLPKGLDLSGSRGDELLAMLEAIGTEGKQLRQELNEAKAREDFLTKKLNERFSSQEEEVINRLVGELEMLRRENQRMFQELASSREAAAEDHRRCEKLQAAVDRLQMDVERLTTENFRLKFAADTGYEITGDDLVAAMADGEIGFQQLPTPRGEKRESMEEVPSPILDAQLDHETKVIATREETSRMHRLQDLLAHVNEENRRLKAQQQQRSSSSDLDGQLAKVMDALDQTRSDCELLKDENAELKNHVEKVRTEAEAFRQKCSELEIKYCAGHVSEEDELGEMTGDHHDWKNENAGGNLSEGKPSQYGPAVIEPKDNALAKAGAIQQAQERHAHCDNFSRSSADAAGSTNEARQGSSQVAGSGFGECPIQTASNLRAGLDGDTETAANVEKGNSESATHMPQTKTMLTLHWESDAQDASSKPFNSVVDNNKEDQLSWKESPDAVVDWKYLATSPGIELRNISEYVHSAQDMDSASEVDSEVGSKASHLFTSTAMSSTVKKFLSGHERRPSLGGLIVARAQDSPPGTEQNLAAHHQDQAAADDTMIDESYLASSPDYVTANEISVAQTPTVGPLDVSPKATGVSIETGAKGKSITPYFTPKMPHTKLHFNSLTSGLESLRKISRKAREDIKSEIPLSDSALKKETLRGSLSLEHERRWIQKELGRIRLDRSIPGDRYPDNGNRIDPKTGLLSSSTNEFPYLRGQYVPRWRRFQYRRKRTSTFDSSLPAASTSAHSRVNTTYPLFSDQRLTGTRLSTMSLQTGTGRSTCRSSPDLTGSVDHETYGSRIASHRCNSVNTPSQNSSDEMSDEYTPLPDELLQPQKLAEGTPTKLRSPEITNPLSTGTTLSQVKKWAGNTERDAAVPFSHTRDDKTIPVNSSDVVGLDERPSSPTDDISASDSVSMVSTPVEKDRSPLNHPSPMSVTLVTKDAQICNFPKHHQSIHTHLVTNSANSKDLMKSTSGGASHASMAEYLDALAEKVILEADSGVSLASSTEVKNGLGRSMYHHGLLSQEEQTYANSLINKYLENSG